MAATTVAAIAAKALDKVATKISGIIKTATVTRTTQGAYNPTTGSYETTTASSTGRAVFDTSTPIPDALAGYVGGPGEELVYFEGLTFAPKENDTASIGGVAYTVKYVGDIVSAGTFFACTVVKS